MYIDEDDFDNPFYQAERIQRVIDEMPMRVRDAILDDISADTMVGSALRQKSGEPLLNRLTNMRREDMGLWAEKLCHASNAWESSGSLKHVPHAESLFKIIDGAGDLAYKEAGGEEGDHDEGVKLFYDKLNLIVPAIPGASADGEPMAMEQIYFQEPEDMGHGEYDVLKMARDELTADNVDPDTKEYWESIVRQNVPELRDVPEIYPDDIPLSGSEFQAISDADSWNASVGKASGQMLNMLTGSNKAPPPSGETMLTDVEPTDYEDATPEADTGEANA